MARPQNPEVRRRLLIAGLHLIHEKSFNAIGVKDVTDAGGIPKGSFYSYYGTKEEFGVAVLRHYWMSIERDYGALLTDESVDPVARISGFFRAMAEDNELRGFAVGCLIGDLTLELASGSAETRAGLAEILDRWESLLEVCLREAQDRGTVPRKRNIRELSAMLIEAWEGAVLRSKVEKTRRPYLRFEEMVLPALVR